MSVRLPYCGRRQACTKGYPAAHRRRGVDHGSGFGVHRWVVEQPLALLHWFRRLRIRREIRDDIHKAFLSLACSIICWRRLQRLLPRDRRAVAVPRFEVHASPSFSASSRVYRRRVVLQDLLEVDDRPGGVPFLRGEVR